MKQLPQGYKSIDDVELISLLINDEIFKSSIEETMGKLTSMYVIWEENALVYEFLNGTEKYSDLKEILKSLRKINYSKQFEN